MTCSHQLIFYSTCGHRESSINHALSCRGSRAFSLPEGMPEPDFPIYMENADIPCQEISFDPQVSELPCALCRTSEFHAGTLSREAIQDRKVEWTKVTAPYEKEKLDARRAKRKVEWFKEADDFEKELADDTFFYAAVEAIDPSFRSSQAICLSCENQLYESPFHSITLPCSHSFHLECINSWIITRESCPFCRIIFNTHLHLVKRPSIPSFEDPVFQTNQSNSSFTRHISGYRRFSIVRGEDGFLPPSLPLRLGPRLSRRVGGEWNDYGVFVPDVDDGSEWDSDTLGSETGSLISHLAPTEVNFTNDNEATLLYLIEETD